jgi:hypothetical protein
VVEKWQRDKTMYYPRRDMKRTPATRRPIYEGTGRGVSPQEEVTLFSLETIFFCP